MENKNVIEQIIEPRADEKLEVKIKCCSKYILNYVMRVFITVVIIGFSFYKLITSEDCSTEAVYISLITSLASFWTGIAISPHI